MRKIQREIIFQDANLDTLIMCLPYFKIYGCPENFPKPLAEQGHYPYFFEYAYELREGVKGITEISYNLNEKPLFENFQHFPVPAMAVKAYDRQQAKNTILSLLNTLSDNYFFSYKAHQSWFITLDGNHELHYGQEGYWQEFDGNVEEIEPVNDYHLIDPTVLVEKDKTNTPHLTKLSDLLDIYFNINSQEEKEQFLSCCSILSKAQKLQRYDLSAAYLFIISSLEGLIQLEYKDEKVSSCESCSQPLYKVSKKFKAFIDKYCYEVPNSEKNKLYGLRSALVHKGELLTYGARSKMFFENQQDLDLHYKANHQFIQFSQITNIAKTCFRVFLKRNYH